MKKFASHHTVAEVKRAAKKAGFKVNSEQYDHRGSDWISVEGTFAGERASVLYSCMGRFFGKLLDGGVKFSSDKDDFDGEPWFDAMLDFFYVAKVAA